MAMCKECYSEENRATPRTKPADCLEKHEQYVCSTCGRCICYNKNSFGIRKWQSSFTDPDVARLYLRTADYDNKTNCGIYKIKCCDGRVIYKIFPDVESLRKYVDKSDDKFTETEEPVFRAEEYTEYPETTVRKLGKEEVWKYMGEIGEYTEKKKKKK